MNRKKSVLISAQEKELLQRLKNSKSKDNAFRELVNQSKKNLYFQIRRLLLNHEDTNDVLQNVYLKIYRSIHKFKEESKLSTWMYSCLLYTSPSPRDTEVSRMPSSA